MKRFFRVVGIFLAIVLLLALVAAAITWAPDKSLAELTPRWAPQPSQFVEVDGLSVHLRDEGPRDDPRPIVLIHGVGASLHTWDGWAEALKTERRVIRFDLPGFGLTGSWSDDDYNLQRHERFVVAMLDRLGVQRAVLVGNSFGGQLAWLTAARNPERVERIVLVDALGYAIEPKSIPLGFRIARNPWLAPLAEHLLPRNVVAASVRNTYGDPAKVTPEIIDRYYELTLRAGNRHAISARLQRMVLGQDAALIATVHAPTLILWGRLDRLIPIEAASRFAHDIAGSRLVIFEDLGHVPQEEDPARTVAAAREFLQAP